MAFHTERVDDFGVEIERPKSCRGYDTRCFLSTCGSSDRGSTTSRQVSSVGGIYTRYINPAICLAQADTSMESLSGRLPSVIPPLDLNSSGETLPSTDSRPGASFTIHKACEVNRISQSDAFSNWLSGKKKLKSYEQAKQKEIEEHRKRQLEEKKLLAEKKYQDWLAKKTQPKEKPTPPQAQPEIQAYQEVSQTHDDSESNRRAWEQNKLEEQRRKREQMLKARERQKLLEEQRKKQAAKAWKNWIAEAPLKPKPVPLNKGFLTLKGTISDIFVNPNLWQEPYEVDECD